MTRQALHGRDIGAGIQQITDGTVKLLAHSRRKCGALTMRAQNDPFSCFLCSHLEEDDLTPNLESARTFPAVLFCLESVPMWAEVLADRSEGRQEALSMARRLETTHGSFTLTCRLMRVLAAVVEPTMVTMLHAWHDLLLGGFVAAELVGNQRTWHILADLEQLSNDDYN